MIFKILENNLFLEMDLDRLFKDERLLKSVLGLSKLEFEDILPIFEVELNLRRRLQGRQRAFGAGRKSAIDGGRAKLFFILFYLKVYPTMDLGGVIFGMNRSQMCRWVNFLLPVLEKVLGRTLSLPVRRINSIDEFLQKFPTVKDVFIDGTERPCQRPKSSKNQRRRYSGKKKRHTRKNTVISDDKKRVLLISPTKNGKVHDKKQADKEGLLQHIPPNKVYSWLDKGYTGIKKAYPNHKIMIPSKKTKGGELTASQKQENSVISSLRMTVEHAIGGIKRFGAATNIYRNRKGQDDKFILLSAALWNFHLNYSN